MKVTAFCPGHITGFFIPCVHRDPLRSGSRGAGLCVDRGVTTTVNAYPGSGRIEVTVNGVAWNAPVTLTAARTMLGKERLDIVIESSLGLPSSAGFGMSAAGALSTSLALAEVLGRSTEEAFAAAHRAELSNRTGLGDVAALSNGGMTFRRREGLPPYGRIDRIADSMNIVAAVVGPKLGTAEVLSDRARKAGIMQVGRECYEALARNPTSRTFFCASREFAERTGLASGRVAEALQAVHGLGDTSMIMLGNSVFARGDLDAIEQRWRVFGPTYRLSLDKEGPRIIDAR
jgi:pantoate kinase